MSWETILLILVIILFLLLIMGQWIAFALGSSGVILLLLSGGPHSLVSISSVIWNNANSYILIAVPLFILMGQLILRSGVSGYFYDGVATLLRFLPGGLLYTNIVACSIFAALSGSSVATAVAVGTVAIPEMTKKGYSNKIVLGSLAAGGTLGILIPPSVPMIVYGALVQVSVGKLFMAGIIPGIIMAFTFMIYITIRLALNKELAPPKELFEISLRERFLKMVHIIPIAILMVVVLGGIYTGFTTPTEASAVGVVGSLVLSAAYRRLSFGIIKESLLVSVQTSCMVLFIIVGAQILSTGLSSAGIPRGLSEWIVHLNLSKWEFFIAINVLYFILGCFIDGISMIYLTLPVLYPIIDAMGFDFIWFGVILVILIELGQITPPMGLNLFAIHGISGGRPFDEVVRGSAPYIFIMLLNIYTLAIYPRLVLFLPSKM